MSYLNNSKSFNDIEDVDDSTFLNHPRQGSSGYVLGDSSSANQWEAQRQQLFDERRRIEEKTLQSTKNSLGLIYETEKIGLQTGEELLHQREQLNNVNEKLDSINSVMRVSQKHLTSMKSIFGGFKNYFSKGGGDAGGLNKPGQSSKLSSSTSDNKLQHTIETIKSDEENTNAQINHPAFKRIGSGAYSDSNSFDEKPDKNLTPDGQRSKEIDRQLDSNLSEMSQGIGRLKELAMGLGSEIEGQNQLLDTLGTKSDRAHDTISNQNRQMKRILKS